MRLLFLLVFGALVMRAELLTVEVRFSDSGCASCTESLGDRLKRIRGVESAVVDAGKPLVRLTLAPGNRARLSVIQGRIEQDGARVSEARIDANGSWRKTDRGYEFVIAGTGEAFSVEQAPDGAAMTAVRQTGRVTGFAKEPRLVFTPEATRGAAQN